MGVKLLVGLVWVVTSLLTLSRNIGLLSFLHPSPLSPRVLREGFSHILFILSVWESRWDLVPRWDKGWLWVAEVSLCVCISFFYYY